MSNEDKLLTELSKAVGVVSAADASNVQGWVSTGNYALNWAISNRFVSRGWPLGHVAELYGDPSSGKTFLLSRAIAEIQRMEGVALLDDTEHRFSKDWARRKLGVDVEALLYHSTGTVEDHYRLVKNLLDAVEKTKDTRPVLMALDSLGILGTDKEREDQMDKADMTRAKQIRKMFRLLVDATKGKPFLYLAANHTYEKIGASPWESSRESSGGGGFKYQSSVRLSLRTPKKVKGDKGDDLKGMIVRGVVEKNSITIPFREASVMIPFDKPIVPHSGLVDKLLDLGYLDTTKSHTLVWQEEDTGIKAHKSNLLKQDESAVELLTAYPDLLTTVDEDLATKEEGPK